MPDIKILSGVFTELGPQTSVSIRLPPSADVIHPQ